MKLSLMLRLLWSPTMIRIPLTTPTTHHLHDHRRQDILEVGDAEFFVKKTTTKMGRGHGVDLAGGGGCSGCGGRHMVGAIFGRIRYLRSLTLPVLPRLRPRSV